MPSKQETPQDDTGFAPAWRPDTTDASVLEGVFTDLNEGSNEYGFYPIVSITPDTGEELAWHAMSDIAKTQFLKAMPQLKHRLRITWEGKVPSKVPGRKDYTKWRVENLTMSPEERANTLLSKFNAEMRNRRPEPRSDRPRSTGQFDDEPPF